MPPPIPTPRWIVGRGWNQETLGPRPLPDRRRSRRRGRATGRSGSSGSTAMPAGPTARRCARPGSPPRPRRPPAAGSSGPGATRPASSSTRRWSWSSARCRRRCPSTRDRALARAQEILLSNGLTAVADMGTSAEDWPVMRRAGDAGRLRVRILVLRLGHRRPRSPSPAPGRRPGSTTGACAWSGSSSISTARSARAAPG